MPREEFKFVFDPNRQSTALVHESCGSAVWNDCEIGRETLAVVVMRADEHDCNFKSKES